MVFALLFLLKNPRKIYNNSRPLASSAHILFYMNTSGVKIRPALKKIVMFNSYSRERENLNTFLTLVLIYKEPVYEKTSISTSKKLRNFWNYKILCIAELRNFL